MRNLRALTVLVASSLRLAIARRARASERVSARLRATPSGPLSGERTIATAMRSRRESRGRGATPSGTAILFLAVLYGCGGGGGGGGDDRGVGGPTDAQLLACQGAVQVAGETALGSRLAAADTCAEVVACVIREDVDGTEPEPCLAAATSACRSALASSSAPATTIGTAFDGPQCAGLGIADLETALGLTALASRCSTAGGDVASKGGVAACLGASVECAAAGALAASAPRALGILAERGIGLTAATCGEASIAIHVGAVVSGDGGAVYDGVVDGFPGIAPRDGTPDIAGNQLGVGLKPGATEERAIAEFPMASLLAGRGADAVTSAVLTFNVDDVLSTFGPGTDFDGTASERIQIWVYAGDGSVTLEDFTRAAGAPAAVVSTGPQGTISDATLAGTGPVAFEVDLTVEVMALARSGATHVGIVFATDDAGSGTSIDDLGPNSAGPPGVGGAKLPFFTINGGGAPTCGNGDVDPGEECDDGNATSGDGCDGECRDETPTPRCGDGTVDAGEECDDRNTTNGDGCSSTCREEPPPASCGDGVRDGGEECDDGVHNSDTAPDACRTDCRTASCGDGVVDGGERCDPPGPSCSGTCQVVTVDAAAQLVACQDALVTSAARLRRDAGDALAACLRRESECVFADGGAASCRAAADRACATAASEIATARAGFAADFPAACVGRPPAELVVALAFQAQVAGCAEEGHATDTLGGLAECIFRTVACPVTRAYGALGAVGGTSLASRGALPAELACAEVQ